MPTRRNKTSLYAHSTIPAERLGCGRFLIPDKCPQATVGGGRVGVWLNCIRTLKIGTWKHSFDSGVCRTRSKTYLPSSLFLSYSPSPFKVTILRVAFHLSVSHLSITTIP